MMNLMYDFVVFTLINGGKLTFHPRYIGSGAVMLPYLQAAASPTFFLKGLGGIIYVPMCFYKPPLYSLDS